MLDLNEIRENLNFRCIISYYKILDESSVVSFALWAAITGIIMGITAASYRAYLRRNKNETTPS